MDQLIFGIAKKKKKTRSMLYEDFMFLPLRKYEKIVISRTGQNYFFKYLKYQTNYYFVYL